MSSSGEIISGAMFPERIANGEAEVKLQRIQTEFDHIGKLAWQSVLLGEIQSPEIIVRQQRLQEEATIILSTAVGLGISTTFLARYYYDDRKRQDGMKVLNYPSDSSHYVGEITGKFMGVLFLPVKHPMPNRGGETGFRLCAQIHATKFIGLQLLGENPEEIYIPIGELYLEKTTVDQLKAETLRPND